MGSFVWTYVLLWNWPETLFKQGQLSFRQEKHKPISLSVFVLWLRGCLLVYSPREWGLLTKVWQMSGCSTAGSKAAGMSPPCEQVPPKLHPWRWNSALFRTKTVLGVIALFQGSYKVYHGEISVASVEQMGILLALRLPAWVTDPEQPCFLLEWGMCLPQSRLQRVCQSAPSLGDTGAQDVQKGGLHALGK